jgi:hypothetical protein
MDTKTEYADTGWIDVSVDAFFTIDAGAGGTPGYRVKNGILYMRGVVFRSGGTAPSGQTICFIPRIYTNEIRHRFQATRSGTTTNATVIIEEDGKVRVGGDPAVEVTLDMISFPID